MQKEEFQHTAYATNAYVTVGPRANQVMQGVCICSIIHVIYFLVKILKVCWGWHG